ncbi:hypothetical protein BAUCODRAFT_62385 [Baudoinia panamericana UAMH 10762]|uniref:Serine hydrolase domain-containing protein n=1 Tax=Baudoinia panamericana (strain UAMH 10762) TaxID=717646 RepID=M2MU37_BAUPA|nr:uncharacterized protein BAUCODRAFT_62385 [Baudoinia panamericana UAMH 10762]EMD00437.1 hypothetical protein BAUCODRAFT_62385 [Baudoinia panamericana UAMH 10762]
MRFLCLHGSGASGAIFKSQTAPFRAKLPCGEHEFDFIDAPHSSPAGPAIAPFFAPPYYSFLKSYQRDDVQWTLDWLRRHIKAQSERYDAALCFSQGCAVLASLILNDNNERPEEPPLFRAAMFICGGAPLPVLADLGFTVSAAAWELNDATGKELWQRSNSLDEIVAARRAQNGHTGLGAGWSNGRTSDTGSYSVAECGVSEAGWITEINSLEDVFGLDLTQLPSSWQIQVPSVHVVGSQDPRRPNGIQLAALSPPKQRLVYDHGGAHDIPRRTQVSQDLATAVQWLSKHLE